MENVTTTDMRNHGDRPKVFNLARDPGERYPLSEKSKEYKTVVETIRRIADEHRVGMKPAAPQLNWCDRAVMNWSPPGCEEIGQCIKPPTSKPWKCFWPH